jgi:hypothetical protein
MSFTANSRGVGKLFSGAVPQFRSRIDATAYEQAWHYPFPESLVAHRVRA